MGAGRWELVAVGPRGGTAPVRLSGAAIADAPVGARCRSRSPQRGTFNAVASVSGRTGIFAIVVELDPTVQDLDEEAARRAPSRGRARSASW